MAYNHCIHSDFKVTNQHKHCIIFAPSPKSVARNLSRPPPAKTVRETPVLLYMLYNVVVQKFTPIPEWVPVP